MNTIEKWRLFQFLNTYLKFTTLHYKTQNVTINLYFKNDKRNKNAIYKTNTYYLDSFCNKQYNSPEEKEEIYTS